MSSHACLSSKISFICDPRPTSRSCLCLFSFAYHHLADDSQDIFPRQCSKSMCFSITNNYLIHLYLSSVHFNIMVMSECSRIEEIGSDAYRIQCQLLLLHHPKFQLCSGLTRSLQSEAHKHSVDSLANSFFPMSSQNS